ncbi:hypothetical protein H6P81_014847 [Aristolochia fimbriata]|uniref:Cytochrome P450 n=1 Tax=Aristolochia fimbriata TaxID=158543 RepID=A0AAV7E6S5_ARIFI|nr:hypothetical protein H6P81_014847 [Aristolochia fimbriata]
MELHLPSILLLFICCCSSSIFFLVQRSAKRSVPAAAAGIKLPPGPRKLPIIGNIHNLVGSHPHRVLRDLAQKYGPLMHLRLGQLSVIVVSSPDMAKEMFKTHDLNFSQRPEMIGGKIITYGNADLVFAPYGDFWRQLRKICILEVLSTKRVQSFSKIREEETMKLVRLISMSPGSAINLSKKLFSLSIDITARGTFGDRCEDRGGFKAALDEAIKLTGGFNVADLFPNSKWVCFLSRAEPKFQRIHIKLDGIVSSIIEAHREKMNNRKTEEEGNCRDGVEDLVDVLLRVQKVHDLEFELTQENIKGVIFDIFAAGTETSSTTMVWAMSYMLKKPKVMQKAQEEIRRIVKNGKVEITENEIAQMNYLKLVIRETLRLCPPLPLLLPRESIDDCEIGGYQIPKKSRVLVNFWAIGRDPKYWDNPEDFVPERFLGTPSVDFRGQNFELIPFGSGRRGCPGILFGLATIERALASLLYYFDWKLADGVKAEDLDMSEAFGITLGRKSSLCVSATPYKMELHLPSILLLLICSIIFLLIFVQKEKRKKPVQAAAAAEEEEEEEAAAAGIKLPPGPRKLPIIGNIHKLVGSHPHYRVLRDLAQKYGPLVNLRLGQRSVVVVSSPDMTKEMFKTHDLNFSQRPEMIAAKILTYGYADLVVAPYGDFWRQLRKICILEVLSAKRVQSFSKIREEETTNLVRFISSSPGSAINLSKKLFMLSIDITARGTFGDRCEVQEGFKEAIDEVIKLAGGFNVADLFPNSQWVCFLSGAGTKFERVHRRLDGIVTNIIEAHRAKKKKRKAEKEGNCREGVEGLVDVLLRVQKDHDLEFELTQENIKGVIFDIFAAGTETSSTAMVWAMSYMLKNPRVMQKAQEEIRRIVKNGKVEITENEITQMNYLKLVIRETLRLCPPLPLLLPRESINDCEIGG